MEADPMSYQILIIDDHPCLREDLVRIVREACPDCEPKTAAAESEAMRLIAHQSFAMVVTDLRLGSDEQAACGGLAILRAAKRANPSAALVLVSSHLGSHLSQIRDSPADEVLDRSAPGFLDALASTLASMLALAYQNTQRCVLTVDLPGRHGGQHMSFALEPGMPQRQVTERPLTLDVALVKQAALAIGCLVANGSLRECNTLSRLVGSYLWDRLFREHQELLQVLGRGSGGPGGNAGLALRFTSGPEDLDLPLELLFDGQRFLALDHPLTRTIRCQPAAVHGDLPGRNGAQSVRLLLCAADTFSQELDNIPCVDAEVEALQEVFQRLAGKESTCLLASWETTYSDIRSRLRQSWQFVHYAGHGLYDEADSAGGKLLFWERACTRDQWRSIGCAQDRNAMLSKAHCFRGELQCLAMNELEHCLEISPPRIVYLNCCYSARTFGADAYCYRKSLGLLHAVVRAGVPIAVGHRWPVLDELSNVRFVREFYERLLEKRSPEQALLAARKSVSEHEAVWASPVMVMQMPPN